MRKSKKILLGVGILLLVGIGVYYVFRNNNSTPKSEKIAVHAGEEVEQNVVKVYTTVSPSVLDNGHSLTLIGTVLSNEFATIYARRSGIIKDLYIDIGDSVQENQTIGVLLPAGDLGQSSANIYEKQVRVEEAEANLAFIQKLSDQMIGKASLSKSLQEIEEGTASAEMLAKIKVDIESSERELEQLEMKHVEQLEKLQNDIVQEREQALVLVDTTLQVLEHIMLGDAHNATSLSTSDMRTSLGVKDTSTRRSSLDAYRTLQGAYERNEYEDIASLLDQTYATLTQFLYMIELSTTRNSGEMLTQTMLEEFTQMLLTKQSNILGKKEMLEDLDNIYATTQASQAQEKVMLENMINKGKAMLGEKLAMLETALETAEQQVGLVEAEQNLKIQQAKNMINIAKANLSKEYATSGNDKIVTPFGGTVSKRMVQVGDVVSMGMPLYELIDVPTSLAKNAKREVQFGLPEEYLDLIHMGDTIAFTSAQREVTVYTGTIHRISPQVDQMSKTVTVQATLSDDVMLPHNSRVNITLSMIEQIAYQIPSSTIIYTDGEAFIPLLNKDNEVELLAISVLAEDGEFADIQGDLTQDDAIVMNYSTMR